MNRSYNYTSNKPGAGLFGSSLEIRNEFTTIQTGFTEIETEIDAKAAIIGQAYTGTHDFTAGILKVKTPTLTTEAVSKAYADGLVFAVVLPDQTGNSGKFVTTDGTTASWADVKPLVNLTKTADATLSATEMAGNRALNNTGAGGAVNLTLPDATTGLGLLRVTVTVAQYLRLTAAGTNVFRYGGVSGAAGGYIRSNVVGVSYSLICTVAGIWDIHDLIGTLNYDK